VWRKRVEFGELKKAPVELFDRYTPQAVVVEDATSGQSLIRELKNDTNLPVVPFKPDSDKYSRACAVQPTVEAGLVRLPTDEPWLGHFLGEIRAFPMGLHEDQVDAFVMAVNYLRHNGVMSAEKAMELFAASWFGIAPPGGRRIHQIGIELAERQREMERRYRICETCGEPVMESSYISAGDRYWHSECPRDLRPVVKDSKADARSRLNDFIRSEAGHIFGPIIRAI
jgi:predicted phage terminase large subunit-like protein